MDETLSHGEQQVDSAALYKRKDPVVVEINGRCELWSVVSVSKGEDGVYRVTVAGNKEGVLRMREEDLQETDCIFAGDSVKVFRESMKEIEEGWIVGDLITHPDGELYANVYNPATNKEKTVQYIKLLEWNK